MKIFPTTYRLLLSSSISLPICKFISFFHKNAHKISEKKPSVKIMVSEKGQLWSMREAWIACVWLWRIRQRGNLLTANSLIDTPSRLSHSLTSSIVQIAFHEVIVRLILTNIKRTFIPQIFLIIYKLFTDYSIMNAQIFYAFSFTNLLISDFFSPI